MKPPQEGMSQTAIPINIGMKVLRPEIHGIEEADSFFRFIGTGRQHELRRNGKEWFALPGSEAVVWYRKEIVGTWESRTVSAKADTWRQSGEERIQEWQCGSRTNP